jgi:hypothetical protein
MEKGRLLQYGNAQDICSIYESLLLEISSDANEVKSSGQGVKTHTDGVKIDDVKLLADSGPSYAFFQHSSLTISIIVTCSAPIKNPAVWVRFMRSDGVVATSWLSHEPDFIDLGSLEPGKNRINVTIDDLMLGDGFYFLTVGLFPEKKGGETAFYMDPLCMWDKVIQIEVKRRTRPLSTIFDQPMRISAEKYS